MPAAEHAALHSLVYTCLFVEGGFGPVSHRSLCLCGCCHSPRQQDGPGGCSGSVTRAKWHQVLERRWNLVQLAPGCWGFAVCSNKNENSPSGVHTCKLYSWNKVLVALASDGVWLVSVPLQSDLILNRFAVK